MFDEFCIFHPIRIFLFTDRFWWNFQGTSRPHWSVIASIFSVILLQLSELLRVLGFRVFFYFTREYVTKVSNSHSQATTSICLFCVKISLKSAQPFSRYSAKSARKDVAEIVMFVFMTPYVIFYLPTDLDEILRVPQKHFEPSVIRFWAWSDFNFRSY